MFAAMSITGNVGSFMTRVYLERKSKGSFAILVMSLCQADLLMGVYLTIIGSADLIFQVIWKALGACVAKGSKASASIDVLDLPDRREYPGY